MADIARELNVEAVVEGSVLRSGDRVRITAQLIRAPADQHIWAKSYEAEFSRYADAAKERSPRHRRANPSHRGSTGTGPRSNSPGPLSRRRTRLPQGTLFLEQADGGRSEEGHRLFSVMRSRWIRATPRPIPAWPIPTRCRAIGNMAFFPPQYAFPLARAAATEALALNPDLGQAHTSLAFALDLYGWEWDAAEKEYERAIKLSPAYATLHLWYAWHLMVTGRIEEGIVELRKAESLDPLSLIIGRTWRMPCA